MWKGFAATTKSVDKLRSRCEWTKELSNEGSWTKTKTLTVILRLRWQHQIKSWHSTIVTCSSRISAIFTLISHHDIFIKEIFPFYFACFKKFSFFCICEYSSYKFNLFLLLYEWWSNLFHVMGWGHSNN